MIKTTFVAGNNTMFKSPNAALRFEPDGDKQVTFEVPMLATGGQMTGIQNTNLLGTYIRNLLRNELTRKIISDSIDDGKLAQIWNRKSSSYFTSLKSFNEFVAAGLDSTKYYETIQKLKPVQESYINLKAFAEVLLEEYETDVSKLLLVSRLKSFLRWLVRTETLEVIPQSEALKMVDTNGLKITYSGSLCIYQLCLPSLSQVDIVASQDKDFIAVRANLSQFHPSDRLEFTTNDTIEMNISKFTPTFTAKLTGRVKLLDKSFPVVIVLDQEKFAYTSMVQMEGFSKTEFKIANTGKIFTVGWQDMVDSISGQTKQTKVLEERAMENFKRISNNTNTRLDLIQQRKRETQLKYQSVLDGMKSAKERADTATTEYEKTNSRYKVKVLQLKSQQERYSSMLQQNASLLLIEKDVSTVCTLTKCKDKCIPLMACNVCQKPVQIKSKQWDCNTRIEKVRNSQLVEVDQTCQETKYFFIPIYTG